MKYYQMYPELFTHNFCFNSQWEKDLVTNKYKNLEDALSMAKQTNICLREINWRVYEVWFFGLMKIRIPLERLRAMSLLSPKVETDCVGDVFNYKS